MTQVIQECLDNLPLFFAIKLPSLSLSLHSSIMALLGMSVVLFIVLVLVLCIHQVLCQDFPPFPTFPPIPPIPSGSDKGSKAPKTVVTIVNNNNTNGNSHGKKSRAKGCYLNQKVTTITIPKYKYVDIPLGEPEPEYYSDEKEMKKAQMRGKIEVMSAFKKMKEMMKNGLRHESFVYEEHDDEHDDHDKDDHY